MGTTIVGRIAILALLAIAIGAAHSMVRPVSVRPKPPEPIAPITPTDTTSHTSNPAPIEPPTPAALGLELSVDQAKALYHEGRTFVDARSREDYTASHVEGAFWLNAESFSGGKVPPVLNYLDPTQPLVIYCSGGHCDASHNLAILLQQAGYAQCHIMTDGLPGWTNAGLPVASGPPENLE